MTLSKSLRFTFSVALCAFLLGIKPSYANISNAKGWAYVNYVVDASGAIKEVDIIEQSEFHDISKHLKKNLTKKKGLSTNKMTNTLFIGANKHLERSASKSFFAIYSEAEAQIKSGNLTQASNTLSKLKKRTQNLTEQGLFYWLQSRIHYKNKQWQDYDNSMMGVFNTADAMPPEMALLALKSATTWYIHDQNFEMAGFSLKKLDNLLIHYPSLSTKLHDDFATEIQAKLVSNPSFVNQKKITSTKPFFRKLFRDAGQLALNSGNISDAQLRCDNKVQSLAINKSRLSFSTKGLKNCYLIVKTDAKADVTLIQSGQLNFS